MLLLLIFPASAQRGSSSAPAQPNPDLRNGITSLDIAPVWSGHPVGFTLLTHGDQQYVAFYDSDRRMTVAQRTLGQRTWRFTRLPSTLGWDSHNSVTLALDRQGFLHVMGNMHVSPLVYFRSTRPNDASSLQPIAAMTGANETRITYPVFSHAPDGALLLEYRSGGSGAGDNFRNRYDENTRTWQPLTPQPLFFGGGKRNAYPLQPVQGGGFFHQVWVWRDTPQAETNHDLSYARSQDLVHWESADGKPLTLPLTLATPGLIVDPSPPGGGLLNGTQAVGFDAQGRVVLSYLKYDAAGNTQLFFARFENGRWVIRQASAWSFRWDFHGNGSLVNEIAVGPLQAVNGRLQIALDHTRYGAGDWEVDPATLRLGRKLRDRPSALLAPPSTGMVTHTVADSAPPTPDAPHYRLEWQTLPPNRDQPRTGTLPPPSMLRLLVEPTPEQTH